MNDRDEARPGPYPGKMRLRVLKYRFIPLLSCLILQIGIWPVFAGTDIGPTLLRIFTIALLITGVFALSSSRRMVAVAILIALPALLSLIAILIFKSIPYQVLTNFFLLAFYGFITLVILRSVLRDEIVTSDTIYGALCVYLLIGTTWAVAYSLQEALHPGSFYADTVHLIGGTFGFAELLYYSFVTITTLGYGDITPIAPAARSLASLESTTGVLYTAVLVARLVGSYGRKVSKQ